MAAKKIYYARNPRTRKNCMVLFHHEGIREFIIFDTETTGLTDDDTVIEFAAIKCGLEGGKTVPVDQVNFYIKPKKPMGQKVVSVHGISNEYLEDKPDEKDVFPEICKFLGDNPILVGHNVGFDIRMLANLYARNGAAFHYQVALDTLEMSRDLFDMKDTPSYKLDDLARSFHLDSGIHFHNALDDAKATLRLLNFCYTEYMSRPSIPDGSIHLFVRYLYYWQGRNKHQAGIYVATDHGLVYYSTFRKQWVSSQVDLSKVDINRLETDALFRTGIPDMAEFGRMTEKKFEKIKNKGNR